MHLPSSLKFPIETHKNAHKAIRIGKKRNETPFLPALFTVAVSLPAAILVGLIFTLLKLDIRFKARPTKGFSAADAGVVGIDSTKAQRAEENLLVVLTSSTVLLRFSVLSEGKLTESQTTPKHDQKLWRIRGKPMTNFKQKSHLKLAQISFSEQEYNNFSFNF